MMYLGFCRGVGFTLEKQAFLTVRVELSSFFSTGNSLYQLDLDTKGYSLTLAHYCRSSNLQAFAL
jgi:hypothetical protein